MTRIRDSGYTTRVLEFRNLLEAHSGRDWRPRDVAQLFNRSRGDRAWVAAAYDSVVASGCVLGGGEYVDRQVVETMLGMSEDLQ